MPWASAQRMNVLSKLLGSAPDGGQSSSSNSPVTTGTEAASGAIVAFQQASLPQASPG